MKRFYFDTETTGLDKQKNEIVQFSGIVEIDDKVVEEIDYRARPDHIETVSQEALDVTGNTLESLSKNPLSQHEMYGKIVSLFDRHCNKYDRSDKMVFSGHNIIRFDIEFLNNLFIRFANKYLFSYIGYTIDTFALMNALKGYGYFKDLKDTKLQTCCNYFGINIDKAHDSLFDIRANRELVLVLEKYFKAVPK